MEKFLTLEQPPRKKFIKGEEMQIKPTRFNSKSFQNG